MPDDVAATTVDAIETSAAPKAIGPYSQAIRTANLVFVSGQIGLDPATGALGGGGIGPETHQVFRNLEAILRAAGTDLAKVVRSTVYLADLNDFAEMNAIYAEYMPAPAPARSTVQVARLPREARVEIDVIATI